MENLSHEVVTTRITWDMSTGETLEHDWYVYAGPWEKCKGGASRAEQAAADQQRQQENQLMQQQLSMQMNQLNSVNAVLDPMIKAGGLAPGVESAMTSLVMNQLPQTFRNLQGSINQNLVARGLSGGQTGAGGGQIAQQFGQLGAMQAAMQQQGLSNIQLDKQGALMNELGMKMGIGSQFGANVGGFNQGAGQALGAGVTAANNVDQAQTSWMGPVFGALGSIGGGIGSAGFGKGGAFGCWIARAIYGAADPRAWFARERLWKRARREVEYALIMAGYLLFGVPIAALVKRSRRLTEMFQRVFDGFISRELHG